MGKEEEFSQMIRDHEGIIFKITTLYTHNRQDQKDLYQDIVYQLWKSFDSFRQESKRSTWMYRVAMNTAITHIKNEKKTGKSVSMEKVVLDEIETNDQALEDRIKNMYVHINRLSALEKGLILLLLEGKKYDEIAEITGLSTTNVGTRISRIKNKLKSTMKP